MNNHNPYPWPARAIAGTLQGVDRDEWRQSIEAQLEAMLDRQLELITILDLMDADDEDREPNGDELDSSFDDEWEGNNVFETEDDEPSLGWTHCEYLGKHAPRRTSTVDMEGEHDGAEPDNEDGPSWSEGQSLNGRVDGKGCMRDEDAEDDDAAEDDDPAGGDVLDEPHDQIDEGNDEPDLCFDRGGAQADGPMGWKSERDRGAASPLLAQARAMRRTAARDPFELTIIAPGVARIGQW